MAASKPELLPVYLNVDNVSNYESVKVLNAVFAYLWAPVKFGGVFHVGVQIGDIEWSYGKTLTASRPGVIGLPPLSDTKHSFRESIFMGHTERSVEAINAIVRDLVEDFPGYQYDVFRKNCNHFAGSLCERLQVSGIPDHINRFARMGAQKTLSKTTSASTAPGCTLCPAPWPLWRQREGTSLREAWPWHDHASLGLVPSRCLQRSWSIYGAQEARQANVPRPWCGAGHSQHGSSAPLNTGGSRCSENRTSFWATHAPSARHSLLASVERWESRGSSCTLSC